MWKGVQWASLRIKTYSLLCKAAGTKVLCPPWWAVVIGANLLTVSRRCGRIAAESYIPWGVATKSPGTVSGEPYTSSPEGHFKSSFGAVRMPSKTHGSSFSQLWLVSHSKADFRCRWKCSTRPFACGWYAVVWCSLVPGNLAMVVHKLDMNCEPLSEVMLTIYRNGRSNGILMLLHASPCLLLLAELLLAIW